MDKCKCGMPLDDEKNRCSCQPGVCKYCCTCDKDCKCGCKSETKEE